MDPIIIPIKKVYAEEILGGKKTVEFRRRFNPKYRKRAIVFYITNPIKQVRFYAVIKRVFKGLVGDLWICYRKEGAIERPTFDEYFKGCSIGYAIVLEQITELKRPFALKDLKSIGINSLQSYRSITKEQFEVITGVNKIERTHKAMLDLVEKYDKFYASVLTNGWYDTKKSSSNMPKDTVKKLLADSKIGWEECLLEYDILMINFMRCKEIDKDGNQIIEEYNITCSKKAMAITEN